MGATNDYGMGDQHQSSSSCIQVRDFHGNFPDPGLFWCRLRLGWLESRREDSYSRSWCIFYMRTYHMSHRISLPLPLFITSRNENVDGHVHKPTRKGFLCRFLALRGGRVISRRPTVKCPQFNGTKVLSREPRRDLPIRIGWRLGAVLG